MPQVAKLKASRAANKAKQDPASHSARKHSMVQSLKAAKNRRALKRKGPQGMANQVEGIAAAKLSASGSKLELSDMQAAAKKETKYQRQLAEKRRAHTKAGSAARKAEKLVNIAQKELDDAMVRK